MRVRALAAVVIAYSFALCLQAQQPSPEPADAPKDQAAESAHAEQRADTPTSNSIQPVTVVVQPPPKDVEAKAREKEQRDRELAIAERNADLGYALAALGAVSLLVVAWQAWESRKSASAAKQSARISGETLVMAHRSQIGLVDWDASFDEAHGAAMIRVRLKNYGFSIATIESFFFQVGVGAAPESPTFTRNHETARPVVVPKTHSTARLLCREVNRSIWDAAQKGTANFWVWVRVEYTDPLCGAGERRWTQTLQQYEPGEGFVIQNLYGAHNAS